MAPGERSKFGIPMFETEVFRKQIYCIEERICDIAETFVAPAVIRPWEWFGAWGIAPPFAPIFPPLIKSTAIR